MGLATNSKAIITKEKQQYMTILINCLGKLWETTAASMEVHRIHAQRGRRSWKPTLDSLESWRMSICLARLVQALKLESLEWNFEGLHTLRPLRWMLCIICTRTCINVCCFPRSISFHCDTWRICFHDFQVFAWSSPVLASQRHTWLIHANSRLKTVGQYKAQVNMVNFIQLIYRNDCRYASSYIALWHLGPKLCRFELNRFQDVGREPRASPLSSSRIHSREALRRQLQWGTVHNCFNIMNMVCQG